MEIINDLNKLKTLAYKTACEHGFHDEEYSDKHLLCLVITELMEAVQADRKGIRTDRDAIEKYEDSLDFKELFDRFIKGSVEDELADTVIRLLDLAGLRKCEINTEEVSDVVYKNITFTENIFSIVRIITDNDSISGIINFAISQVFALADIMKIDLMWHINVKMRYNKLRELKHGCKY